MIITRWLHHCPHCPLSHLPRLHPSPSPLLPHTRFRPPNPRPLRQNHFLRIRSQIPIKKKKGDSGGFSEWGIFTNGVRVTLK
jgi:hypothetical protein